MSIATLIMGLPGSGKSTLANSMRSDDTVVINRDGIRLMLNGGEYKFVKEREKFIFDSTLMLITAAAKHDLNIVVDETMANLSHRTEIEKVCELMFDSVNRIYVNTDIEICISRREKDNKGVVCDWKGIIQSMATSESYKQTSNWRKLL